MKDSLIYGILGGLMGSLYMGWICSPKSLQSSNASLAVVDMQTLISKKSQQLAMKLTSEAVKAEASDPISHVSIQEAASRLKEDLNTFAVIHNLVLLSKGSVVGGDVPDRTQEVLSMIEKGE